MTGHPGAEILALWAGGDIDGNIASELGLHVESCAECLRNVDEIKRTREILAGHFAEPSEAELQQLRRELTRRLDQRRRGRRSYWSLASAAAVIVIATMPLTHRTTPIPPVAEQTIQLPVFPPSVHLALILPEEKEITSAPARRAHPEHAAGLRAVNLVPGANGSTELRLTTADPNVVILLAQTERPVEQ